MPTNDVQLQPLLDPVVSHAGLVLEDVVVSTVGRRRLVRVVVDLPDDEVGAVDLDRVAAVSRAVGDALDADDVLGDSPYALEVTTPGVDRPLTERRHWLRARTRMVRAELAGREPLTGRLVEVTDAGPVLLVTVKTGEDRVELSWDDVRRGVVEVEFRTVPKDDPVVPDDADDADDVDDPDDTDDTEAERA